jgi:hypothetical protein
MCRTCGHCTCQCLPCLEEEKGGGSSSSSSSSSSAMAIFSKSGNLSSHCHHCTHCTTEDVLEGIIGRKRYSELEAHREEESRLPPENQLNAYVEQNQHTMFFQRLILNSGLGEYEEVRVIEAIDEVVHMHYQPNHFARINPQTHEVVIYRRNTD